MKRLIIIFLSIINYSCSQNSFSPVSDRRIVSFGDSHTYGSVLMPVSFVDDLRKKLWVLNTDENYWGVGNKNKDLILDNQSMGGTKFSSRHQYERIMAYNFTQNDIVVMMLGYNDAVINGTSQADLELFRANLKSALERITNAGAKAFVGTCIVATPETYAVMNMKGSKEACDLYTQEIKSVVSSFSSVVLVDTSSLGIMTEDKLQADHVHFNWNTHQQISQMFYDKIKSLF